MLIPILCTKFSDWKKQHIIFLFLRVPRPSHLPHVVPWRSSTLLFLLLTLRLYAAGLTNFFSNSTKELRYFSQLSGRCLLYCVLVRAYNIHGFRRLLEATCIVDITIGAWSTVTISLFSSLFCLHSATSYSINNNHWNHIQKVFRRVCNIYKYSPMLWFDSQLSEARWLP